MISLFSRLAERVKYGEYSKTPEFAISRSYRKWDNMLRNLNALPQEAH